MVQFRITARGSAGMAGSAGTAAKAVGLVFSGWIIGKFKFSARTLSAWNVVLGFFYFGTLILFSIVSWAQICTSLDVSTHYGIKIPRSAAPPLRCTAK